jgi:hypothetical protein
LGRDGCDGCAGRVECARCDSGGERDVGRKVDVELGSGGMTVLYHVEGQVPGTSAGTDRGCRRTWIVV